MPAIDPGKLLSTLSVLLGPHGGIKSQDEVVRLVTLMEKFSKKMVSKVVYINILRATKVDVLEKFLNEKGWTLINFWFQESVKASNWSLTLELLKLLQNCPMTIERLRENSESNQAPKLVRHLANYATNTEKEVTDLAKEVFERWMAVIQCPPTNPTTQQSAPLLTRGSRIQQNQRSGTVSTTPSPTPGDKPDDGRVNVTVFTETVEIVRLLNMQCQAIEQQEPEFWHGRGGKTAKIQARLQKAAAKPKRPPPAKKAPPKLVMKIVNPVLKNVDTVVVGANGAVDELIDEPISSELDKDDKDYAPDEIEADDDNDVDIDEDEEDSDEDEIFARARNAINRNRKFPVKTSTKPTIRDVTKTTSATPNNTNKDTIKLLKKSDAPGPDSPLMNEVNQMRTSDKNSIVKDELTEVDDLLKDDNGSSLDVLKDFADSVANDLKKEKDKELAKEKERLKEKERAKEKARREESRKDKSSSSSSSSDHKKKDRHRDRDHKDRDRHRDRDKDHERRRKEREERRRKEKEREKKEKLKREPKPFKETEMRNGLNSTEKDKIKETVQRLKDEALSKKKDNNPSPKTVDKPKVIKKDIPTVDKASKSNLSFEALMSGMDSEKKKVKAAPIKNKNKDLLASINSGPTIAGKKGLGAKEAPNVKDIFNMRTEDKSSKIIPASDFLKERSKSLKRPAELSLESAAPKIKIKSPAQLKESNGFGDFLSNIMKDDVQPRKKVIKIAELKQKTEEEERAAAAAKKNEEEEKDAEMKQKQAEQESSSGLSFYRDTLMEEDNIDTASPKNSDDGEVVKKGSPKPEDIPPEDHIQRDVRGQLVIARGTFRPRKRVSWPEEVNIVDIRYFEVNENERVNVNKLKFEEQRKKEFELEKNALKLQTKLAGEEARPWPTLSTCDFTPPEVEYGGQSLEKVAQQQRETSVLQALYFNTLPSNPSEPENASAVRGEKKDIPLEDDSQEETFMDYSESGWPSPLQDMLVAQTPMVPQTDSIFASLQNMMGGDMGMADDQMMQNRPTVKIASEMEMYKQGLIPLPPKNMEDDVMGGGVDGFGGEGEVEMYDQFEGEPYEHYDENMMPGMMPPAGGHAGGWPSGPFPPQQQQFGGGPAFRSNWRGPGGGFRGFPHRGRGGANFNDNRGGRGYGGGRGFDSRGRGRGFNDGRGGTGAKRDRVCKFWNDRGYCRDGDRCLFQHPPKR